jgi:hypothetical protein
MMTEAENQFQHPKKNGIELTGQVCKSWQMTGSVQSTWKSHLRWFIIVL